MLKSPDSLCNRINFVTELPASLLNMNISDVGFFKGKLRSQTFFEVPPDCYWTSVNTIWRSASLKVHKIEIFYGFDFEICIISLLVMWKY